MGMARHTENGRPGPHAVPAHGRLDASDARTRGLRPQPVRDRAFYLAVVAGLLMFLGQHEARLRRNIVRLARWPSADGASMRAFRACSSTRRRSSAPAARWSRGRSTTSHGCTWPRGRPPESRSRGTDRASSILVPPALADAIVLCTTAGADRNSVFLDRKRRAQRVERPAGALALARRLDGTGRSLRRSGPASSFHRPDRRRPPN